MSAVAGLRNQFFLGAEVESPIGRKRFPAKLAVLSEGFGPDRTFERRSIRWPVNRRAAARDGAKLCRILVRAQAERANKCRPQSLRAPLVMKIAKSLPSRRHHDRIHRSLESKCRRVPARSGNTSRASGLAASGELRTTTVHSQACQFDCSLADLHNRFNSEQSFKVSI